MTTTIITPATVRALKVSTHIGQPGDRINVKGVVRKVIGYGAPYLIIVHDCDGNEFVIRWNAKKPMANERVLVNFDAIVEVHETYKEVKRTSLTGIHNYIITNDDAEAIRAALRS